MRADWTLYDQVYDEARHDVMAEPPDDDGPSLAEVERDEALADEYPSACPVCGAPRGEPCAPGCESNRLEA